jgi:hypothetical protein
MFSYIREDLLLEKYIEVKKSIRTDPTQAGEVVDLPGCHVSTSVTSTPSIFPTWRTVVLRSKRPELRCDSARACSGLVSTFFAAANATATAFVRIWRLTQASSARIFVD